MNISKVNAYLEQRNREQYRSSDQFGGFIADALSMFSNTDARALMNYLELGELAKAGEMVRDRLIAEYGAKAEAREAA